MILLMLAVVACLLWLLFVACLRSRFDCLVVVVLLLFSGVCVCYVFVVVCVCVFLFFCV